MLLGVELLGGIKSQSGIFTSSKVGKGPCAGVGYSTSEGTGRATYAVCNISEQDKLRLITSPRADAYWEGARMDDRGHLRTCVSNSGCRWRSCTVHHQTGIILLPKWRERKLSAIQCRRTAHSGEEVTQLQRSNDQRGGSTGLTFTNVAR